jgi:hypothetical protein
VLVYCKFKALDSGHNLNKVRQLPFLGFAEVMAEDLMESSPLKKFGARLRFHLDRGTRPKGVTKVWRLKEFGVAVGKTGTTVDNWCDGEHLPPQFGPIEFALFGENKDDDSDLYRTWRSELRELYSMAAADAADRDAFSIEKISKESRQRSDVQPGFNLFPGKRNPIVHWHHTSSDKKRNEYLDEEPVPVDFFVSVGAFANAGSQITIRMKDRPGQLFKIKSITLVRLHPKIVRRLTVAQLLHANLEQLLQDRIRVFVREVGNDSRDIKIRVRLWADMPSFHGYLFSKRRFTNQWAFNEGKLHVDVPLLEYPSPDWDAETEEAIKTISDCELQAEYLHGKKISS